jgi:hypothetical protein
MNEVLIAGLLATASHIEASGRELLSGAESLKALVAALEKVEPEFEQPEGSPEHSPYKNNATGRMNLDGALAIQAAFEAGATITEVSKRFGIHTSAANYRHKQWLKSKQGKSA